MGYAIFPLRTSDGSRVLVNAASIVALREDSPGDLSGRGTIYLASGQVFYLREAAGVVYQRIVAALADNSGNPIGP